MANGENGQLWPQRGEFSTNVGGKMMVLCRRICAPKWHDRRTLCGTGTTSEARNGMGWAAGDRNLVFYMNDRRIAGGDHIWFHDSLVVTV